MSKSYRRKSNRFDDDFGYEEYDYNNKTKSYNDRRKKKINYRNYNDIMRDVDEDDFEKYQYE